MPNSEGEMESTPLDDLKLEIGGALYTLTRDALVDVCDFLLIAGPGSTLENVKGKSRSALISHVTRHLEREELLTLEDQGMAELLRLQDKIAELQKGIKEIAQKEVSPGAKETGSLSEQAVE